MRVPNFRVQGPGLTPDAAQALALTALTYILDDAGRAGRFLAVTGLSSADLPSLLGDGAFLGGVLDFVLQDEALLAGTAEAVGLPPASVTAARRRLPGAAAPD